MKKTQVPLVLMVDYSIYISSRGGKTGSKHSERRKRATFAAKTRTGW